MTPADRIENLRIEIDTHECELTQPTRQRMLGALDTLARQVKNFPISDVRIVAEHNSRDQEYVIKTTLILPNETITNREHGPEVYSTFERCLDAISAGVEAYKRRLDDEENRHKHLVGTRHEVEPDYDPDAEEIDAAIDEGDYARFRKATYPYEVAINKRAGRWVERFPDIEAKIGHGITLDDIVEGVFLRAFEGYPDRSTEKRFGEWLAGYIDATIKALQAHPDEELREINLARTTLDASE